MMGSSDGSRDPEEYQKTPAEMMNDEELRAYMDKELRLVRKVHAELGKQKSPSHTQMFLTIRDKYFMPNLYYLAEIGRLPSDFDISALEAELAVPDGVE
jgi:hypothetical protein